MIAETVVTLAIFFGGAAIGYYTRDGEESIENDGCNGHHWEDPIPANKVSTRTLENVGYKKAMWFSEGYYLETTGTAATLKQKAVQKCEDCGEWDTATITHGTVDVRERLDKR